MTAPPSRWHHHVPTCPPYLPGCRKLFSLCILPCRSLNKQPLTETREVREYPQGTFEAPGKDGSLAKAIWCLRVNPVLVAERIVVYSWRAPAPSGIGSFRFSIILWSLCAVALGPLSHYLKLPIPLYSPQDYKPPLRTLRTLAFAPLERLGVLRPLTDLWIQLPDVTPKSKRYGL